MFDSLLPLVGRPRAMRGLLLLLLFTGFLLRLRPGAENVNFCRVVVFGSDVRVLDKSVVVRRY